jgi:hypothetical protein
MGKRRFWGSLSAVEAQTIATRGSNQSLEGHVRGWDIGVKVIGHVEENEDRFDLYITSGSHNSVKDEFLGSVLFNKKGTKRKFIRYGGKMPD